MTTHRYNPPERKPSQWGGLSDEAKAALGYVAMGPSVAGELLAGGVAAEREQNTMELRPEVANWACGELNGDFANGALSSWKRYESQLGINVPNSIDELYQINPNLASTLNRLYDAKQALTASGETTAGGLNVGGTMHLALMPWQAMRGHLTDFRKWMVPLRDCQNIASNDDDIHGFLLTAIQSNLPLYRDADNPELLLTPTEYLDQRIARDGPWGVMLVQTCNEVGISQINSASPDEMTDKGTKHLELAGHPIDAMGIFEWAALTLQNDPSKLSTRDYSWLLANRVVLQDADWHGVPLGDWVGKHVNTSLCEARLESTATVVRLAVT